VRERITDRIARVMRWATLALALILMGWTVALAWTNLHAAPAEVTGEPTVAAGLRHILGLKTAAVVVFGIAYWWISGRRGIRTLAIACLLFGAVAALMLAGSLQQVRTVGTPAEISAYTDWRQAIPPGSNVAMIGVRNSAAFVWFTLDRGDYLSIDQSSGVVFSRATAAEVERRSAVLEPLVRPSWKIMTYLARWAAGERHEDEDLPLNAPALSRMCRDPQLNFVIAAQLVGFAPLRHSGAGEYKGWYLYDCARVRSAGAPA
jgi:hypothetical protein